MISKASKFNPFSVLALSLVNALPFSVALATERTPFSNLVITGTNEVCGERIAEAVFQAAKERFGDENAETLNIWEVQAIGNFGEDSNVTPFKVNVSDEVGGSQWLVVAETEDCVIEFLTIAVEE
jgi:hypothetical protein